MNDMLKRALEGKHHLTVEETMTAELYEAERAAIRWTAIYNKKLAAINTRFGGVTDVLFRQGCDIVVLERDSGIVVIGNDYQVGDLVSALGEGRVLPGSQNTMISYSGTMTLEEVTEIALRFF